MSNTYRRLSDLLHRTVRRLSLSVKDPAEALRSRLENPVTPVRSRQDLVRWISRQGFSSLLEIGPFDCPVVQGPHVKYFDVLNKQELLARAQRIGRVGNLHNIPDIDYVEASGDLIVVGERFDACLSAHVIEHQIDLVKHLQDVSRLLNQAGAYIVICPDKRYCFDHFIAESTIAGIVDAHLSSKPRHSLKSIIETTALTCHNEAFRHWKGDHGPVPYRPASVSEAIKEYQRSVETGEYVDVHAWQFTPDSLKTNLRLLNDLGYCDLIPEVVFPTARDGIEFYAVLRKKQAALSVTDSSI